MSITWSPSSTCLSVKQHEIVNLIKHFIILLPRFPIKSEESLALFNISASFNVFRKPSLKYKTLRTNLDNLASIFAFYIWQRLDTRVTEETEHLMIN